VIRHFTASGIVLSHDEKVLLIQHRKLGIWLYPGGHIEPDEDPAQAVLREVAEETGLSCRIVTESRFGHPATTVLPAPFTILVHDIPANAQTPLHQHIDMVYVLTPEGGQAIPRLEEVTGCAWVPLARVADLQTPPEVPSLVAKAAEYARQIRLAPGGVRCRAGGD
jgi:8-oxo-dGTP pyrophosphatase MutT (NUDIX family)